MANRSYLYSTSRVPDPAAKKAGLRTRSIGEFPYGIPYLYKLLLSGEPRACSSSIWSDAGLIALIGDFDAGLARLETFLGDLRSPLAQPLVAECRSFFAGGDRRQQFFLLECGEIFDMTDAKLVEQNRALLEEVRQAPEAAADVSRRLNARLAVAEPKPGMLGRWFGKTAAPVEPSQALLEGLYEIGLGSWSDVLYFQPDDDVDPAAQAPA